MGDSGNEEHGSERRHSDDDARDPEEPVVVEVFEDRPGEHDPETAADPEQTRDERDPAGHALAWKLVSDDSESEREHRAADALNVRAAINTGSVVARAAISEPPPNPASTTSSVRFLPNMSPSRPAIGVATEAESR